MTSGGGGRANRREDARRRGGNAASEERACGVLNVTYRRHRRLDSVRGRDVPAIPGVGAGW